MISPSDRLAEVELRRFTLTPKDQMNEAGVRFGVDRQRNLRFYTYLIEVPPPLITVPAEKMNCIPPLPITKARSMPPPETYSVPAPETMIAFIAVHRNLYGVGPIVRVLPIASSTYHEHAARRRGRASA